MVATDQARSFLAQSAERFCEDVNSGRSLPLMESDVVAGIYHHLRIGGCPSSEIFLETRVCDHSPGLRKYDLVIGVLDKKRACVKPSLVVQIKAFQRLGLSPQQHRRRFQETIETDIPSLLDLKHDLPDGRIELISDLFHTSQSDGYISGSWHGEPKVRILRQACSEGGVELWWMRPTAEGLVSVEVFSPEFHTADA